MTVATKHLSGIIKTKVCETHGRWSAMEVYRTNRPPLVVINTYMVCYNTNTGPLTFQMQLYRGMNMNGTPSQVRKRFWKDLAEYIEKQISGKKDIIVGMDANFTSNAPNSIINQLIDRFQLIDATTYMNPEDQDIPTCVSGTNHIYYVLMTPDVVKCVKKAHVLPYMLLTESDHLGIIVDFHIDQLLGRGTKDKTHIASRNLSLTSPARITRYVDTVKEDFK